MKRIQVTVRPNQVIEHNDPNAICTNVGWKRYMELRKWLLEVEATPKMVAERFEAFYGPYEFEDNRDSGRYQGGYK